MTIRAYLAGTMTVETDRGIVAEPRFGGRQSRLLFAYLACADGRPVPKGELCDVLWPGEPPASWEVSLAALASKLRALLSSVGLARDAIDGALGAYRLRLPEDAWIDVVAIGANLYQAEGALLRGSTHDAGPHALIAATIARRTFLPDDDGPWVERTRAEIAEQRIRALEILATVLLGDGDHARAAAAAGDVLAADAYRETGYQLLMRAHALAGNRAEALRVYERCRRLLAEDLGIDPSPATERLHLDVLRG